MVKVVCALLSAAALAAAEYNPMLNLFPKEVKTIAIVAPACPPTSLESLDEGIRLLKDAGYQVREMPHVREGAPVKGYRTIALEKRKSDLEAAWLDPEVDLIWCVRGGVGTEDLITVLDWEKLRARPDMRVLGFSNITCLHLGMLKEKVGRPVAAPSLSSILKTDADCVEITRRVLAGEKVAPMRLQALRGGAASGKAIAGHLFLLHKLSATPYRPESSGKVIILECPGYGAKVIRKCLDELRESGFFDNCAAVIFGRLNGAKAEEDAVMREFSEKVKCPVFAGYPYGHTPRNAAISFEEVFTITADGVLTRRR